jgi:hypothetical protein
MESGKLFYKYQSLKAALDNNGKILKDDNGNHIIYSIKNLANNQLFFRRPDNFNDPYDSRTYWSMNGRREKHINHLINFYGFTQEESENYIDDAIDKGKMTIDRDLICYDPITEIDLDGYSQKELHGYSLKESLPKVCCFSGKVDNILMWSHYADSHKGICLRFRSVKDWENRELGEYYLDFDYRDYSYPLLLARKNPFYNLYYKKKFLKINYKPKEYICPKVNYLDADSGLKMTESLLGKFIDWNYEDEYRIIITHFDIIIGLLSSDEYKKGLLKYQKEDLQGIVFGMKISYENAKLVYETVKKNYLDEGIAIKFYEAKEVPYKYDVEIEPIDNIEKYLNCLPEKG